METLPALALHLSCFLSSNLLALRHLRLLFLFTILISWLPCDCDGGCETFTCGFYSLRYPFGKKNSGCGDPALQLDCDEYQGMPLLNISGYQYYLLQPKTYSEGNSNHYMRIVDKNLWGDECNPLSSNQTALFWSSHQFHIVDDYTITLWSQCGEENTQYLSSNASKLDCSVDGWYYIPYLNWSEQHCKLRVSLPFQNERPDDSQRNPSNLEEALQSGFEIKWNFSRGCEDCESRNGFCNYNISLTQVYCNNSSSGNTTKWKAKTTIIVVGVGTGGSALLIVAVVLVIAYRKRSSFSKRRLLGIEHNNALPISQIEMFLHNYVHEMPARFSYSQLKNITDSFAHKLGEGGFGVVYKGILEGGNLVAVKMLDQSRQSETQFMNEVATIGKIHHINLVRLLGYCFEGFTSALVYEYMANGSLDKFILAGKEKVKFLCWEQIHLIALGAARGIAYLHNECHGRIIHFDIKPHNILLDEDFTPKVADFGLAKLCGRQADHVSMTAARGTPGYAAPEVWSRNMGPVTDKSDVYGFGMMLLEMVGGRKNIDLKASRSSQIYFPEWAFKLIQTGELGTRLRNTDGSELVAVDEEKAIRLAKVGLWCIQYKSTNRPSMNRVIEMLEGSADDVIDAPLPFNADPRGPSLGDVEESSSF